MSISNKNIPDQTSENLAEVSQMLSAKGIDLSQLRSAIRGQIITSDNEGYDTARTVFYGGIDRHPDVIVKVANANDIAYLISLAQKEGLELAVRSGGHSMAGHSVSESGIVIDLSAMKNIEIDPEALTAWADAGLTAGEFTRETGKHGLATGFGDAGSVGLGGITLGGGVGFLVRKYGLTIDNLLAAEIVTADGKILTVDAKNHPDLFWAIRGGGGNFGVVARFKFQLHKISTVMGGFLILPANPEVLQALVAAAEVAPEELSLIINLMTAPPMPFVPSEYHGKLITFLMPIYVGSMEEGEKVMAPFRAITTPIVDTIKPMPYSEIYPPEEEAYHPLAAARTMFLDSFDQATANLVFEHLRASNAQMAATQIRVLGGAMARVSVDATAFAHRNRKIMVNVAAMYAKPEDAPIHEAWVKKYAAELQKDGAGAYVNFIGDEGQARVQEAYPGKTWERLREIKAKYDPKNLFHHNQNIPPATN